jgi:hypothetical protein
VFGDQFLNPHHVFHGEALAKVHHHRRFKGRFHTKSVVAQEILQVRIFSNLFNGLLIRNLQFLFDDQRSQGDPYAFCWGSHPTFRKVLLVFLFDFVPRNELCKLYPAIVAVQVSTERQVKWFKLRLRVSSFVHQLLQGFQSILLLFRVALPATFYHKTRPENKL